MEVGYVGLGSMGGAIARRMLLTRKLRVADLKPDRVAALTQQAFSGVDGSVAMAFGYESGAQAVLSCTSGARTPTRASISGTDARIEIGGSFYAPGPFTLVQRNGEERVYEFATVGRGLHYEASEVARCIEVGLLESPMMPLDETISIMATNSTRRTSRSGCHFRR